MAKMCGKRWLVFLNKSAAPHPVMTPIQWQDMWQDPAMFQGCPGGSGKTHSTEP